MSPGFPDVRMIESECGLVNLKDVGLRASNRMALYFYNPDGNTIKADYATVQGGQLFFWHSAENEWSCLDTSALDLETFGALLSVLPLPVYLKISEVIELGERKWLQVFELPVKAPD